jgi:16S rRNA pseudouridine516 synthase
MERIDKVISDQTSYSRKEIKKLISQKRVMCNKKIISKSNEKIDIDKDMIEINNKKIEINKHVYLILNKPKGYISATEDKSTPTVLELVPEKYKHRKLFPAGRLDKDTKGLIIITDDGKFAHNILSPRKHVEKKYEVEIDIPITEKMIYEFSNGVDLKDGKCKTAVLEQVEERKAVVTITEGRYHQIKRMFGCFGAKVLELKRIKMGEIILPDYLKEGECIEIVPQKL